MATRARSIIRGNRNSISRDIRKGTRVEGLAEIQDNLARVVDAVTGPQIKRVVVEAATIGRDEIKRRAPYDPDREKGTHLRDSIFVDAGDESKPDALLGVSYGGRTPGAPHAHFHEYGWINKPGGKPFVRPGLVAAAPAMADHIKTGFRQVIESATGKAYVPTTLPPVPRSSGGPLGRDERGRFTKRGS